MEIRQLVSRVREFILPVVVASFCCFAEKVSCVGCQSVLPRTHSSEHCLKMWSYLALNTSECGLSDRISLSHQCVSGAS